MVQRVLAVDLGATSVRVAAVDLDRRPLEPEVLLRWRHGPVPYEDGSIRWDWDGIVRAVEDGLTIGLEAGPVASIGIDGWGVDYGLLAQDGSLLSPPYSYRDSRVDEWASVADRIGRTALYARTGIQIMPINTVFQLAVHDRTELERADTLLLLPDLVAYTLTGAVSAERSNASTTALLDPRTGHWAADLVEAIEIPAGILPPVRLAGERAGSYRGVPLHLVGSHDTASAFVATPGAPGPRTAFVSSGTWVLVGAERPAPDTSEAARAANFSNELGALGGVRFLKNVVGFWLLERCRKVWGSPPVEDLVSAAAQLPSGGPLIDVTEDRYLRPEGVETAVREASGLGASGSPAQVTRCILESIVAGAAEVVDELGGFLGGPVDDLFVLGGGVRSPFVHELFRRRTGLPVRVGHAEATVLGNALVQGIALGHFADLADARHAMTPAAMSGGTT